MSLNTIKVYRAAAPFERPCQLGVPIARSFVRPAHVTADDLARVVDTVQGDCADPGGVVHLLASEGGDAADNRMRLLFNDPAEAGSFQSILAVVPVRSWREVHEPVHVGTIGKEPDDIASIVDPVDESTHHAERRCLR